MPTRWSVRKGWIFRSERHIPYARIQNIDAVQNVFHRLLGVAEVRVETASGGEAEATMTVLPQEALEEMRRFVFAGRQAGATASGEVVEAEPDVLLRMQPGEVLLYGFIESRGAVVMAGAAGPALGVRSVRSDLRAGDRQRSRGARRPAPTRAFGVRRGRSIALADRQDVPRVPRVALRAAAVVDGVGVHPAARLHAATRGRRSACRLRIADARHRHDSDPADPDAHD